MVSQDNRKKQYTGNGVATTFAAPQFMQADDIHVNLIVGGVETEATSGWSVVGTDVVFVAAPANGVKITIYRVTDRTRTTDFNDNDRMPAAVVNDELDRITLVNQEQADDIGRSMKGSIFDDEGFTVPAKETMKGSYFFCDEAGNIIPGPGVVASPWNQYRLYLQDSVVGFDGQLWVAMTDNTAQIPAEGSTHWANLTPVRSWHRNVIYAIDSLSFKGGKIYRAVLPNQDEDPSQDIYGDYWREIGGSTGGTADGAVGINYENRQMESGIEGYVAYADAAQATPVDGIGGTPSITLTAETSAPLFGLKSLRMSKPAQNVQGQGFGYSFSIDDGARNQAVEISFWTRFGANYAAGDMAAFLWDDDNGAWLPVTASAISGSGQWRGVAYLTDSHNYRLVWHIASTSALAWTFDLDNVQIDARRTVQGAAIGNEQAYTPTVQGLGTLAASEAYWWQIGDKLRCRFRFTLGTVSAAEVQIGLPAGKTTAASITTLGIFGSISRNATDAAQLFVSAEPSKSYVVVTAQGASSTGLSKRLGTEAFASGNVISGWFEVPCAQFQSNLSLAGQNEPIYLANSESVVNTNGVVGKTINSIDGAPLVANTAATYYDMTLPKALQPNEVPEIQVRSKVDGNWVPAHIAAVPSLAVRLHSQYWDNTISGDYAGFDIHKTASGVLRIWQSARCVGYTSFAFSGYAARTWAQIIAAADGFDRWRVVIRNPNAAIEIPPTVSAMATGSAGFTANTIVKPSVKVYDTHNCWDLATGLFTARYPGLYRVSMAGYPQNYPSTMYLQKGPPGSLSRYPSAAAYFTTSSGNQYWHNGSMEVPLLAGEQIGLYVDSGGTYSVGSWFQITRIGA